jgi:hypothetical protein
MKYIFPILMAAALAVAGCQNSDQKANNTVTNDTTGIVWIDSLHQSLGEINKGQVAEITWRFKNTGNEPLIVTDVQVSCGCTLADKPKEPIPSGGEGLIKASFDSKSQVPGNYNKEVTVLTNNKKAPRHVLGFSAQVVEK